MQAKWLNDARAGINSGSLHVRGGKLFRMVCGGGHTEEKEVILTYHGRKQPYSWVEAEYSDRSGVFMGKGYGRRRPRCRSSGQSSRSSSRRR